MPDPIAPRSGLEALAMPGRHGAATGPAGVTLRERRGLALAGVIARRGAEDRLAGLVERGFAITLPRRPQRVAQGPLALAWAGPGQWLAIAENEAGHHLAARLTEALAGAAAICDQSDARVVLHLAGPRLRETLAKGVPLDLHPSAFAPGDAAVTAVALIGIHLWQLDASPSFEIAVPRSYAASFWRWLAASAAEYGIEVAPPA